MNDMRAHIIFHGTGPAFFHNPGCPCVRCQPPALPDPPTVTALAEVLRWSRQAHTAASLLLEEDGVIVDHTLIDCGMGVVQNLATLPTPARGAIIQRVLLTHGHLDHIAGLDSLLVSLRLGRKAGDIPASQPWPLPIYSTKRTWRERVGANPTNPTEHGMFHYLEKVLRHNDITDAAQARAPIRLHPALTVQPIPVEHYLDSVHYLFTFWPSGTIGAGQPRRIALCWDLAAYPAGRSDDVWQGIALDPRQGWLADQMAGVDLLAIESTTWRSTNPGHIGFTGPATRYQQDHDAYGVIDLLRAWQPRLARIVHYDGWDDRLNARGEWSHGEDVRLNRDPACGPVTDEDLRRALRAAVARGQEIDVATPGEVITIE